MYEAIFQPARPCRATDLSDSTLLELENADLSKRRDHQDPTTPRKRPPRVQTAKLPVGPLRTEGATRVRTRFIGDRKR